MALTWLLVLVLLVSHVTADPGDDSVNNLFSDLAPLLALFGEQFAKQFMSESLGWLDNVIFAMAPPLGIVTAIVSAIRVGGPVWLKAVIGRARENRAAAEIELMSSTSHEVGELWNGTAIVRSLGRPEIEQIIYIANDPEYKKTYGLHTLESATDMGYFTIERKFWTHEPAPNISLNIHRSSDTNELYVVAIAGIILQSSVLIFAGFTVYHPAFNRRFYKNDQPVSEYAYPLLLVGTVILATGMVVCSAYLQHKADLDDARILWLQKGHLVSDQSFDSFIIFANGKKKQFLTSRRKPDSHSFGTSPFQSKLLRLIANTKFEFFAIAGSFVGFAGFVLQFQAFRGMHWSTSIAQLIAVFLMTTLRALVRRGLTVKPITEKVLENHEMDWLALGISTMQGHFWERYTGGQGGKSSEIPKGNSRPESIVMKPSRWFVVAGDAHLAQRGSLHLSANILRRGNPLRRTFCHKRSSSFQWEREIVTREINSFEDIITSLKDIIASSEMRKAPSATTFTWILKIEVDGQIEDVHLIVRRSDEDAKWRIRVSELEALLSLWMFDFQSYPTVLDSFKSNSRTRVLGPRTSGLNRDLRWWMSDDVNRGINRTGRRNVPTRPDLTIGFRGLDTYAEFAPSGKVKPGPSSPQRVDSGGEIDRLSMITTSPVDTLLAQHIFSSFMWAISEHIPSEKINKSTTAVKKGDFFNANDINSFLSCRLENRTITGLAADIERTGLVSLDEAYTFIIPPLSVANQLPVEVMADFIRQNVKEHEVNMRWEGCRQHLY
ncbi:hypothetical protein BZA77DRAFT_255946 [Pyronema omphalodes]|nr:hypothetical protein BZA77DRAFT_255946 [Pyronema omphalodes]